VLGILVVFVYHSCRFFDANNPWHVRNAVTYGWVRLLLGFTEQWMMPLMIVISGASVFYAVGSRSVGRFLKDRVLRLLVPLVVGIFSHSIWQIYLEAPSGSSCPSTSKGSMVLAATLPGWVCTCGTCLCSLF
jgi:fucose 4-O-acetylase-like acetyltransferase